MKAFWVIGAVVVKIYNHIGRRFNQFQNASKPIRTTSGKRRINSGSRRSATLLADKTGQSGVPLFVTPSNSDSSDNVYPALDPARLLV